MTTLLAVLVPIAVINSVATLPPSMAGVVASLGSAGKFVPLFLFGLLLAIGLDTAFDRFKLTAQGVWRDPSILLVSVQLIIGAAMLFLGYHLMRASGKRPDSKSTAGMTPMGVFSVVAGATLIGLPGALFYFAAIDQILRADLTVTGIVNAILFYNAVYLFPLILIVLLRRLFGTRADPLFSALKNFFDRWGKRLVSFGLYCLGAVLVADAVGWFTGFPLLQIYIR
jgi:hypothetical protein